MAAPRILLLAFLLGLVVFLRKPKEAETPLWTLDEHIIDASTSSDANNTPSELKLPSDWSHDQYRIWLEGEMPEGWTHVQWVLFSDEQLELLENQGL